MRALTLAWRLLGRDLRSGELGILILALLVAVGSVSSVGFFADRVKQSLLRESGQILGADLLMTSDHPWDLRWNQLAQAEGLAQASTVTFPSMMQAKGSAQLADIKAVSGNYPLRGSLRIAPGLNMADASVKGVPEPGTVWLDERMMSGLGLAVGDTVAVGSAELKVKAVLTQEPDRGISLFALAPRVMMNQSDLTQTRLIQTGSRVTYRMLVAGDTAALKKFRDQLQAGLERGQRIEDVRNARPEIRNALERAEHFLSLVALLAVIIAASAVALSARRFSERHVETCAVLRCLGASQALLARVFAIEFTVIGVCAAVPGCALGYAAQFAIAAWLGSLVAGSLPQPSLLPALQGGIAGMLLLMGFALPPVLRLRKVSALRVIRREWSMAEPTSLLGYGFGFLLLAGLLIWQAGDLKLGFTVTAGFSAAIALFAGAGVLVIGLLARAFRGSGVMWRYAIANLRRRRGGSVLQLCALTLGLMALLLLGITRNELMTSWLRAAPADAPNRFVINIQPSQLEPVEAEFREQGLAVPAIHPMVRGRLVAINDKPVKLENYADDRAKRLVDREFNLSWSSTLPPGNTLVAGSWFQDGDKPPPAWSIEEGIAQTLDLHVGDTLTYEIAGERVSAPVANLRKLDWDSMRVNFFAIAAPGLLERQPASYITSFHLPPEHADFANRLVKRFPNLTLIDTSMILHQVREVMEQMARAVQFVFLFSLAAGLLVLYAAINASQDERLFEAALMRALGASGRQVFIAGLTEYCLLGVLAGLFAATGAAAVGFALAERVFQLDYVPGPEIWLWGLAAGLLCGCLGGWSGARIAVRSSPMLVLREAE
jgi:putative ABC transport system permease protein